MEKYVLFLGALLSLSFYGCGGDEKIELSTQVDEVNYYKLGIRQPEFFIKAEHNRKLEEAAALKFSDSDFLKTRQPMCDDVLRYADPWTGLIGDHAHDNRVYMEALCRFKKNLSVKDSQLVINAKSGVELNMAEDLYRYLVDLIAEWNGWIKEGRFSIVKTDEGYDIDPIQKEFQPNAKTRLYYELPINILSIQGIESQYFAIEYAVEHPSVIGAYLQNLFNLNFGSYFEVHAGLSTYYCVGTITNACKTYGVYDSMCRANYIATYKNSSSHRVRLVSLRNPHHHPIVSTNERSLKVPIP